MTGSLCATVKDLLGGYNIGNKSVFVNWGCGIFVRGDWVAACEYNTFGGLWVLKIDFVGVYN
jgi:hypothetical protein